MVVPLEWLEAIRGGLAIFLRPGPQSCRVTEISGEFVGTVASLHYSDRFSWLSMVLVDPQHRGNGIGTQLLQEGLATLGQERCCRLDATVVGRQIYSKYLFADEYLLSRMSAVIDTDQFSSAFVSTRPMRQSDLMKIGNDDLEGAKCLVADCLREYNKKRFVIDTPQFASDWLGWLRANGFTEERMFFRMYRGEHLYPGLPKINLQ